MLLFMVPLLPFQSIRHCRISKGEQNLDFIVDILNLMYYHHFCFDIGAVIEVFT